MPNPKDVLSYEAQKIYDYFYDVYSRGGKADFSMRKIEKFTGLNYVDVLLSFIVIILLCIMEI